MLCHTIQSVLTFFQHHWCPEGRNVLLCGRWIGHGNQNSAVCENSELLQHDFKHHGILLWTQTLCFEDFHNWYCAGMMIKSGIVNDRKWQAPPFLPTLLANTNCGCHGAVRHNLASAGWFYERRHYLVFFLRFKVFIIVFKDAKYRVLDVDTDTLQIHTNI